MWTLTPYGWGTGRIHHGPGVVYIVCKRPLSSSKTLRTTRRSLFPGFPGSELVDVISAVNEDLEEMSIWCCRNSLLINPDKTKLLYVGVRQLMRTLPTPLPSATMVGTQIKPVTVAKDLGVYIDGHLNFNEHIIKTASDCMLKLTRVNRTKHLLDKKKTLIYLICKCFRFQQIILLFDGME